MATREDVTEVLRSVNRGEPQAFARLMPMVYDELRVLAHKQRARAPEQTLNTTALVHEAYLKLVDQPQIGLAGRRQFYACAATTMRNILVDNARRRLANKRGGHAERDDAALDQIAAPGTITDLLAIDQALGALARINPRLSEVVEMHVFAGLEFADIAACLEVSKRTVVRDYRTARVLLRGSLVD
jgi:RNA polymerase sigma factor (TIGR02999 family)